MVGQTFVTGNSTVKALPVGTILEVVGKSQLQVIDEPAVVIPAGTEFKSKYGPAVVVDFTSTGDLAGHVAEVADENEVFYVAKGTSRVRRTAASNVK